MSHRDLNFSKQCANCGDQFYRDKRCTWAHWERAAYCSRTCFGAERSRKSAERRRPLHEEFQRHFVKRAGCWEWTWMTDKDGYGLFPYAGKQYRAHVIALKLDGRPVSKDRPFACHTCDNPAYVNPAHLYPGTQIENMADAKARGRTCVGEKQHCAKLTTADVIAIRSLPGTDKAIAYRFGISRSNVSMIRSRRTWRHVP